MRVIGKLQHLSRTLAPAKAEFNLQFLMRLYICSQKEKKYNNTESKVPCYILHAPLYRPFSKIVQL
jgi:hypothetical protein